MSSDLMTAETLKSLTDIARLEARYPEEAYHFVREGLNYAVEQIHGPPTPALLAVTQYLAENQINLTELFERLEEGRVEPRLAKAIEAVGGYEKLNRHVNGPDLCWALRDLALKRWGMIALTVLRNWNIRQTYDFGRIVFDLIKHDYLQQQPEDELRDFDHIYDFSEAIASGFRVGDDGHLGPGNAN